MNKALIGVVIGALTAGGVGRAFRKPKKTTGDKIIKVLENPSVITGIFGLLTTIITVKYGRPGQSSPVPQPVQTKCETINIKSEVCDG